MNIRPRPKPKRPITINMLDGDGKPVAKFPFNINTQDKFFYYNGVRYNYNPQMIRSDEKGKEYLNYHINDKEPFGPKTEYKGPTAKQVTQGIEKSLDDALAFERSSILDYIRANTKIMGFIAVVCVISLILSVMAGPINFWSAETEEIEDEGIIEEIIIEEGEGGMLAGLGGNTMMLLLPILGIGALLVPMMGCCLPTCTCVPVLPILLVCLIGTPIIALIITSVIIPTCLIPTCLIPLLGLIPTCLIPTCLIPILFCLIPIILVCLAPILIPILICLMPLLTCNILCPC